jgi:hypothetical protein
VPTKSTASNAVIKPANGHGNGEAKGVNPVTLIVIGLVLIGLGIVAPDKALSHFTVFMLACFRRLAGRLECKAGTAHSPYERH